MNDHTSKSDHVPLKQKVDEVAESPYLKFIARSTMIIVSLIAAPYIYWLTNNMLTMVNTVGGVVIVQGQQQQQITSLVQTQTRLLDSQATEATARATQDVAHESQLENIKAESQRNTERIDKLDDKINQLYQWIQPTTKR